MPRARTNIEIDEGLLSTVMGRYEIRTKTEAVDLALRHLSGQPMSRDEALGDARGMRDRGRAGQYVGLRLPGGTWTFATLRA